MNNQSATEHPHYTDDPALQEMIESIRHELIGQYGPDSVCLAAFDDQIAYYSHEDGALRYILDGYGIPAPRPSERYFRDDLT